MIRKIARAIIEVAFIIFLFYANLLMGEFSRSGMGRQRGLAWAIHDMVTRINFEIALIAAIIGYLLFESLRKGSKKIPATDQSPAEPSTERP